MKRFSVFHPFLFAIFPILFLFAYNIDEARTTDLLLLLLVITISTLILLLSVRLITKNYNKAGVITSCFLTLFYSYGYISDLLFPPQTESFFNISHHLFLEPAWLLLFISVALLVKRSRHSFITLTRLLNIVAASLVVISLVNIGIYTIKTTNLGQEALNQEDNSSILKSPDNLPDIYYIILDSYARADTLKEIYNYDNSEFTDYLTDKGFYVASKSRSNYSGTILSVPSSLNMEYPDVLRDMYLDPMDTSILYKMIVNNKVSQLLKSVGYRYILVSSGWDIKDMNKYADVYSYAYEIAWGTVRIRISSFTNNLIRSTALRPFADPFITADARNSILYAFDTLAKVADIKGPKFVFTHITSPHPPWHFNRNGGPALPSNAQLTSGITRGAFRVSSSWYDKERYVDQLIFINRKVEAVIEEILSKSDVAPIIILQGDHGPWVYPYEDGISNGEVIKRQQEEKMKILNAYYLPGKSSRLLYESITPVNSFRVVFNLYFDMHYDLLEEESYFLNIGNPRGIVIVPPEGNAD